jgi:hypothetical protein
VSSSATQSNNQARDDFRPLTKETQMDFLNEFGLAFAVALPVVVIVAMNAFLALSGERGTLLVPGTSRYP